ncbi:MAG: 1-acyl-sn-glycerol-3-phosphate acyltransferase [bacterium]|nr:1-acyl-sn-glycerol-3-phosphate acyltransferase [bacterium]
MIPKIFQTLTYWPIFLALKFFVHYKVEGQENLKGLENKGVIFASNHASYLDGPISAASMPRNSLFPRDFFPIRFLAFKKFFGLRGQFPFPISILVTFYVRINGSIPVEKTGGDLFKALSAAINGLKQGGKLWIYPEGAITKDGKLRQGKRGVVFLHRRTKAPIVPVAIIGNYGILSPGTILRKNKIKVKIGKPIYSLGDVSLEDGASAVMRVIGELIKSDY